MIEVFLVLLDHLVPKETLYVNPRTAYIAHTFTYAWYCVDIILVM